MAGQYVTQKEFNDYGAQLQGQIAALSFVINKLLPEAAPTKQALQSFKDSVKQAAADPGVVPDVVRKSFDETINRLLR